MFLLDTNVISELRRPRSANANVLNWAAKVGQSDLYLSAITLFEIELGARQIERRDKRQGAILRDWIDSRVMPSFVGRILPVDALVAVRCAQLHVPNPRPEYDALIAATALVHGLRVVTRNVKDIAPMGVAVVNPFEP